MSAKDAKTAHWGEGAFSCECECPSNPVKKLRALIARWDGIEPAAELEGGATP